MPCCCVTGCHNRAEKGYKLYKLPQGHRNEIRRKLWIQNIGRVPLPENAYVCQTHFTEDQFELKRADRKKLLKWNAIPTIFSHNQTENIKCRSPPEEESVTPIRCESSNLIPSKEEPIEKNLKTKLRIKTVVRKESCKDNSDEVKALKYNLNTALKEIHTLRTIIFQQQEIIEKLIEESCVDET